MCSLGLKWCRYGGAASGDCLQPPSPRVQAKSPARSMCSSCLCLSQSGNVQVAYRERPSTSAVETVCQERSFTGKPQVFIDPEYEFNWSSMQSSLSVLNPTLDLDSRQCTWTLVRLLFLQITQPSDSSEQPGIAADNEELIKAVKEGVMAACSRGSNLGYPVVDADIHVVWIPV